MRLHKEYEIDPDEQRQALAEWLSRKLEKEVIPSRIVKWDGNPLDTFIKYKETEQLK